MDRKIGGICSSILALTAFALPAIATADISLPLSSYRSQGTTDHCWAYAASHLLESRGEYRTQVSVTLETERDLRYWVLHDRLFQRYKTKAELDGGLTDDGGIMAEEGYPIEFVTAFLAHGHPTHAVKAVSGLPAYQFPTPLAGTIGFLAVDRPSAPTFDLATLIQALGATNDDATAEKLIRTALDGSEDQITAPTTGWLDGATVDTASIPSRMLPAEDVAAMNAGELVWLQVGTDASKTHQWSSYYGGKYSVFYVTQDEYAPLAKKSLDAGWPVLDTDFGHVWAVIGYHGDQFVAADSAQSEINYSQGLNAAVGIFVLKQFLAEALPSARVGMPLGRPVERAFPTRNPDVHIFR